MINPKTLTFDLYYDLFDQYTEFDHWKYPRVKYLELGDLLKHD